MRQWDRECNLLTVVILCFSVQTALGQCSGAALTVSASETPTTFATPGYPTSYGNNLYCEWLVDSGVANQSLMLYSDNIDLDCAFGDAIDIYDGSTNSSTALASGLCGSSLESTEYVSTDRYVLVTFTSDASNVGQGFIMTHLTAADTSATGCSEEYIYTASTTPQYLTSASFPSKYSSGSSCRWRLEAPDSLSTVNLQIIWSDIETGDSCKYDRLTIYDGQYICENQVIVTVCSTRTAAGGSPTTYSSSSNSLLVIFTSDSSYDRYGFIIKYTATVVTTAATTATGASTAAGNASSSSSSAAAGDPSSSQTQTEKEVNVPLMAVSALAGSAASLLTVAIIWKIKRVVTRKKTKPGLMTVQSIAPLPPRSTFLTTGQSAVNRNSLSFV